MYESDKASYSDGKHDKYDTQLTEERGCGKVTFDGDGCGKNDKGNANGLMMCDWAITNGVSLCKQILCQRWIFSGVGSFYKSTVSSS